MDDLNLHLSVLQRIAFFILKLAYLIQKIISYVFVWPFLQFFLWAAYLCCGDRSLGFRQIRLIRGRPSYLFIARPLNVLISVNEYVSGLKGGSFSYEHLIGWPPSIPLIALKGKKVDFSIRWGGHAYEEKGKASFSVERDMYIGSSIIHGYFRIINKKLSRDGNALSMECIWTSGVDSGGKFSINKRMFGYGEASSMPEAIYFPPRIVVWILEMIVSISVVTILVGAVYHSLIYLNENGWFQFFN